MAVNAVNEIVSTIASGASASSVANFEKEQRLFSVRVPSGFTEANLALQVSFDDGVNWEFISKKGAHVVVTAVAGEVCNVENPVDLAVYPAFRFLSVSKTDNTTPVVQSAARSLQLLCRSF